ncbi:amidase [Rhodobacterales bacterium]|nr:amidase [Rhodobacterales bacterium]
MTVLDIVEEDLHSLDAATARMLMADDCLTAHDLVSACLRRISLRDKDVKAWLAVSDRALEEAGRLDALPKAKRGRLHGLPIGIKDVFDTGSLPTTYNSPLFQGFQPARNAPAVDQLVAEGAILIGKTDTTEFAAAGRDAATGNPHDLAHTSGGSSAGSAAAVADFHVPLALATQTGGSTIRPASFCGIFGYKPSFGLVSREGVKTYANSLDTVGWYGRSLEDIILLSGVYGVADIPVWPAEGAANPDGKLTVGISLGPNADDLEPASREAMELTAKRLVEAGHDVRWIDFPVSFSELDSWHRIILRREGGASFRNLHMLYGTGLHEDFRAQVENRDGRTLMDYRAALDAAALARPVFDGIAGAFDLLVVPSAPGLAPSGRRPGNPLFNCPWTLIGAPCLNVPLKATGLPLPIGVTFMAPRYCDEALLSLARIAAPALSAE